MLRGSPLPLLIAAANLAHTLAVLEEVIVTAQKRSESLQNVSAAVNVTSADQLGKADIASLEELALYIPSYYQNRSVLGSGARNGGVRISALPVTRPRARVPFMV